MTPQEKRCESRILFYQSYADANLPKPSENYVEHCIDEVDWINDMMHGKLSLETTFEQYMTTKR